MEKVNPRDVAKWFIKENLDNPRNSEEGNTKLQKLLFFSQLIYMCKNNGNTMYEEKFNAFKNGMVLEKVRKEYKNNTFTLINESTEQIDLPENVIKALELTKNIFGNCTAKELSDMSHELDAWNKYFKKSILPTGMFNKEKSEVPYEELQNELYRIEKVINAYERTSNLEQDEDGDDEDY